MQKPKRYLRAKAVRARYGGLGEMTLWRWLEDPESKFPKPFKINGVRFWDEVDLDLYDESLRQQRELGNE